LLIGILIFLTRRKSNKKDIQRDIKKEVYLPDEDITITSIKSDSHVPDNTISNESSNSIDQTDAYNNIQNVKSPLLMLNSVLPPPSPINKSPVLKSLNERQSRDVNYSEEKLLNHNIPLNKNNLSPPLNYKTINNNNLIFNNSSNSLNNNNAIPNIDNINNVPVPVMPLPSPINTNKINNASSPVMSSPNTVISNNSVIPNEGYINNNGQRITGGVLPTSNTVNNSVLPVPVTKTVLPPNNTVNSNLQPIDGGGLPTYVESAAKNAQPNEHVFVAQYYYNPVFNDEFQISPGDVISFGQSTYDDGWAHGSNLTKDTTGVFPLGVVIKIVDVEGKNRDPYQVSEKYRCKPRSSSHTVKYQASTSEKDPKCKYKSLYVYSIILIFFFL